MMARAEQWLREEFSLLASSGVYSTPALNGHSPDYLNMVVSIRTPLSITALTAAAKAFEALCGRTPESKLRGSIEMDVDIIRADNTILRPVEYTRPYFLHGLSLLG